MDGLTSREPDDLERLRGEPVDDDAEAGDGILGDDGQSTRVAPTDPTPADLNRQLEEAGRPAGNDSPSWPVPPD